MCCKNHVSPRGATIERREGMAGSGDEGEGGGGHGHKRARGQPSSAPISPVKRHRSFAPGNGCSQELNYYVEPLVGDMVGSLAEGNYCVLTGVRQSGKSTSALHARELLRADGFECIYLDLPPHLPDVSHCDADRWRILLSEVSWSSSVIPAWSGAEPPSNIAFKRMFARRCEHDKKVILIFDEMNPFGRLPQSFKDSFLATLRSMKLDRKSFCLHSILLIGTDSILAELKIAQQKRWQSSPDGLGRTGHDYSPFSHDLHMKPSSFSTRDIERLLAQYEEDRHLHVDKEAIAASIFDLTGGHKGLVGLCCAELHTAFPSQSNLTLEMWERFSKQNLVRHVFVKPTYYSIICVCAGLDEKGIDLILRLLRSERCVTVPYDNNVECLISEGVLVDNSPDAQLCELSISSLLLHSALLESLQLHLSTKVVPGPHVFDHLWVITKTIERLDWSIFQIPDSQNADQLASEYSIQFEFYVKLKAVLLGAYSASKWLVIPEAKPAAADKRKRLDILVRDGERDQWFAVELFRQGTSRSLQDHYKRSIEYAATHRCIVYMLNFILKEKSCAPSFSSPPAGDVICFDVFCGPSSRMVGGCTGYGCFIERPLNVKNGGGKLSLFSNDFTG